MVDRHVAFGVQFNNVFSALPDLPIQSELWGICTIGFFVFKISRHTVYRPHVFLTYCPPSKVVVVVIA